MRNNRLLFLALILIICTVYWQWFLPGSKVANDFPYVSEAYLKSMFSLPSVWLDRAGEGLGFNAIFSLWSYPATLLMGIFAEAGLTFEIAERIFFIIPFIFLGSYSIWKFLGHFNISGTPMLLASVFYLANTYIILLIDGGQLLIVLAYAFFPLSFIAFEKAINTNFRKKVLAALSVVILGFLDIRFSFVLLVLLLLRFLYGLFYKKGPARFLWFKEWFISGVITTFMMLGFNAFWIVPYLLYPPKSDLYAKLTQVSEVASANIGHSILLLSPHWYKNVFGNISPLRLEFFLIPLIVFAAAIIKKKNYFVGFWLLVAFVSIFLSKGAGEPFKEIYSFLFNNLPGFSLFRDPTKFFFLTTLSYTFLMATVLQWLLSKVKKTSLKILIPLACLSYLLFLVRPVLLNEMSGTLSKPKNSSEFRAIKNILEADEVFSRSFWIPSTLPLSYSSPTHPIVEALRLSEKRPFASGTKGTYEIFNYLREATYMGELFDVAGIDYIVYPTLLKENPHPDDVRYYNTFLNQLENLPWLEKVEKAPVLKVKSHQDKFFLPENIWFVVGSDEIYRESTKAAELSLKNNALIFVEETAGLGKRLDEFPSSNIVLYKKSNTDLTASFIGKDDLIFPAKKLYKDPDASGWWKREAKDILSWRYFLKNKYGIDNQDFDLGGGWAVGEGERNFSIFSSQFSKGKMLLARVMESSKSGTLNFYQGDSLVGTITTKKEEDANVRWFEVGVLNKETNEVAIKSEGEINVVNAVAVLPEGIWKGYLDKAKSFQNKIKSFSPENVQKAAAGVSYKEKSPAEYLISINGLNKDGMVVFASSYDELWKLDDSPAVPVYSFLNGFKVEKDGTYEVSFKPQESVRPSLIISILFAVLTFCYLSFYRKR